MAALKLHYQVAMPQPTNHLFEVTLEVTGWSQDVLEVKMPVWTPGSYLVREYSRHLQNFEAVTPSGEPFVFQKLAKNHWRIQTQAQSTVVIRYQIYANELTVRTNHLDRTHGYFNGAATFFYIPGYQAQPIEVTIVPPSSDWQVATALPEIGENTFLARDFDTLVDSPFEIGLQSRFDFEVLGKTHQWVIWGKGNVNPDRLIADTQRIIEAEAQMFGGLPYDRYLFILHLTNGYGGLEHKDSCSLIYDRHGFRKQKDYESFLQLVAHEFFHLWNVKRIRPQALEKFDYDQENYTPSLWFCEGVTSYYDNLFPLRAGIYGAKTYLRCLSQEITRYLTTLGRFVQPLSESGFDAWIKLYRPDSNTPNSQMSYYLKGAMVTLLLDLEIRKRHHNQKSFDDVMRIMWEKFGKDEIGFTPQDAKSVIEAVAGTDLTDFFDRYLHGLEELDFGAYFQEFGLRLESNADKGLAPTWGARIVAEQNRTIVKSVAFNSPAQLAGLDAGDELIAIDGLRATVDGVNDRLQAAQVGEVLEVTFFHQDELLLAQVILAEPQPTQFKIVPVELPTERQASLFTGWLGESLADL
ncbi:M61 family metallopeptidase [Alkalinema sp. FACHB-956]|uniref:M61 family metallopeptidase n=1 Tax=Alkalinema sp. FACHB-956 TaxID=2692768 RepID=UPI0016825C68|nr:M61 family metallopeptidase [Alkalinema sp. FACHB-956]MBD2325547.1 M61 family metallopeptidase [Alkalinema sp. FACHB-956]